ncbi:MAG: choice-of-anchor A family protein, partial [Acidobacteriota bacterium]
GAGGDGDNVPDFVISDGATSRPALSIGDVEVLEADTEDVDGLVRLESSHPSSLTQSAELLLVEASALADLDYASTPSGSRVELGPGDRQAETPVTVLGDVEPESDETFTLLLDRPLSAVLGQALGTASIVDNDEGGGGGGGGGGGCVSGALGTAGDFNVFVFGSVNQANNDAEGRLAAGGHLQLVNYSIGLLEPTAAGDALVAGQSLIFSNGQVHGGDVAWGTTSQLQNVQITSGVSYQGSPIDFVAERTALEDLAASLASLPDTGTATIPPWNAITLEGTDPELNVFSVPASTLSAATSFTIRVPAGSTALINVSGASVTMQNFGFTLDGAESGRIVFNLHQATSVVVQNIGLQGLLLAPHAAVQFNNGQHNGALIAASLQGTGQSNRHLFEGCLPLP